MMHDPIISAAPLATVDRAALFPALDFIARRIVERRNSVPILSHVRLEALASGALLLSASDLDLEASILVPADIDAPFIVAVPADTFRDLVKAAPKDARLTLVPIDGGLRLTYGRTRQNAPEPRPVESEPEPVQAPVEAVNGAPEAETAAAETVTPPAPPIVGNEPEAPAADPVADALAILSARLDMIETRLAAAESDAPPAVENECAPLPPDPRVRGVAIARASIEAEKQEAERARRLRIIRAYLKLRKERAELRAERDRLTIAHRWERKLRRRNAARLAAVRQRRELDRGALLAAGDYVRKLEARVAEAEKPKHPNAPDAALVAQLHEAWAERDRAREQAAATVKQAVARVEALERLLFKGEAPGGNVVPLRAAA